MRWQIPAKTFLVGEYIALAGGPALIMTTEPSFTVALDENCAGSAFPVNSPAWNFCQQEDIDVSRLSFIDPYAGIGGMGASSAQFLGAFYARNYLLAKDFSSDELLAAYLKCAWNGEGVAPSGYDLLAQHMGGCVDIHKNANVSQSSPWLFANIAGILIHTQKKLATHEHLRTIGEISVHKDLNAIAEDAAQSFVAANAESFINAINAYAHELAALGLQAEHTISILTDIRANLPVLAAKGCGAMGADIILLIVPTNDLAESVLGLRKRGYQVLASSEMINLKKNRIFNEKTLDV